MENRYAYIGSFNVLSGVIDIADPYINSIAVAVERIPVANEKMVKVRRVLCGLYEAYHVIDNETDVISGLLIIHNAFTIDDVIKDKNVYGLGFASSGLSNAIVLVDENYRFDTGYCYNPIEIDAYYDGNMVLNHLPDMPYDEDMKDRLSEAVNKILNSEEDMHPKGSDIMAVIGKLPVWKGFQDFKLGSSQWSVDVLNRLSESYSNAVPIKGGVISFSAGGYLSCYNYRNHRGDTYAIFIPLQIQNDFNINSGNGEQIPLFNGLT